MEQLQEALVSFAAGDVIMRQGDKGDCAYIIEEGQVEIILEYADGTTQQVSTRGPGAIVGEMAIVDESPRVATVKALKDCKMMKISREDYAMRLKGSDPVIQMITQVILTRYRDTLTRATILSESDSHPPVETLEQNYTVQTDAVESIKMANEFKAALDNRELKLHYQPVIDFTSGEIVGFEALMRWTHAEKGPISPGVFIPVAEKSGLIIEASRWALRESCAALTRIEKNCRFRSDKPLWMSVNFSSSDFSDPGFVENMYLTLSESDVQASQLKLEITERLLIQQPDNARETLQLCRKAGMGIAIDDFGTGYSSLSYLSYFPIDTLKIDQSFIRAMGKEEQSLELVKSIIGLGKNMNMTIIAEGVEEVEEARVLREMGCDMAQGFYFAKPMAETDLIELLHDWHPMQLSA